MKSSGLRIFLAIFENVEFTRFGEHFLPSISAWGTVGHFFQLCCLVFKNLHVLKCDLTMIDVQRNF